MKKLSLIFCLMLTLMLGMSSCSNSINGKWYADMTEEMDNDMSCLISIEFKESTFVMQMELPDVIVIEAEGDYHVSGKEIILNFSPNDPKVKLAKAFTKYLESMGIEGEAMNVFKNTMRQEVLGSINFHNLGDLEIIEHNNDILKVRDDAGEKITLTSRRPHVDSDLEIFKAIITDSFNSAF